MQIVSVRLPDDVVARIDAIEGVSRSEKLARLIECGLNAPVGTDMTFEIWGGGPGGYRQENT